MTAGHGRRAARAEEFGKVAVLYGGRSAEREVSLASGTAVLDGLRGAGIDAHGIDPGPGLIADLRNGGFDRAFIVLHGRGGEDGTVQGALGWADMPYTGSGVLGSALAMDKQRTKQIWRSLRIPTPPFHPIRSEADLERMGEVLGFPLIVKPVHEGSSVGMTKVMTPAQLPGAWRLALEADEDIFAERWVDGAEYTAGIVQGEVLPLVRLETPRVFYDYEAKYGDDSGTRYFCPCGLEHEQETELREMALRAFAAVGASGWGRIDFLRDHAGNPWFIEVNTVPGMTSHSLLPMAARAAEIEFGRLVWRILETSL